MNGRGFRSMDFVRKVVVGTFVTVTCLCGQSALAQTSAAVSPAVTDSPTIVLPAPPSTFSGFLKTTLNDFRRLPSKDSLTWLTIGVLAATLSHPADPDVTVGVSGAGMTEELSAGHIIGGKEFEFGSALAAYGIGRLSNNQRLSEVAGRVFRGQLMAQAVTGVIKATAQRTRPDGSDRRSFPSGHTSVTFASATVLQRELGWKAGVPAYAVASYVALARIEKQKHYLSDVAMGAAIGILAGRTVTIGSGDKRFALAPVATPGGAAINFTLLRD